MKVLIIEDELPAQQKLERFLKTIGTDLSIDAILTSVEEATNWISEQPPSDLIFMDIRLEDGICFEIFENVKVETPVIFITAYDEYAIKAFKVNSVDYLLKPLDFDELKNAIEKFKSIYFSNNQNQNLRSLLATMLPASKERFLIKVGGHYKSIQVDDICYFFIAERNNFMVTNNGKIYPMDYSLDQAEKLLDRKRFFRINRTCIVNIKAILDIVEYSSSRLKLKVAGQQESDDMIVSRDRVRDFKQWMSQ